MDTSTNPGIRSVDVKPGIELEYAALKEEILKRMESRQQIVSITLTIAGAYLGVGWTSNSAIALLLYPPLATLLAAGWAQNEVNIREANNYIRDNLENAIPGLGWESYSRKMMLEARVAGWPIDILAYAGIFFIPQIIAIVLGFFRFNSNTDTDAGLALLAWLLLMLDAVAIVIFGLLMLYVRRRSRM